MNHWKLALLCFVVFIVLDFIWLGFIARDFYHKQYGPWLRLNGSTIQMAWWAVFLVYFLLVLAMIVFVFPLAQGDFWLTLGYSALMGLIVYGVYDFTCLAIFKDWPLWVSLVDWLWGGVVCSAVGLVGYYVRGVS